MDMVFSVCQVKDKCLDQNMPSYAVFNDFTKAFDSLKIRFLDSPDKVGLH